MTDIWVISDTHFGHANILKFLNEHGAPLRKFSSRHEMDGVIIDRWNSVVKPQDHVWHLGDVAMCAPGYLQRILWALNGKKRLCLGNHDKITGQIGRVLQEHFEKIVLWNTTWVQKGLIMSHIPLRHEQMKARLNVHGHIHDKIIDDPRYKNVSVEVVDYTPVHIDVLFQIAKDLGD